MEFGIGLDLQLREMGGKMGKDLRETNMLKVGWSALRI